MVAADYKLKDRLGPAVPVEIAGWISSVYSSFDASSFVTQATSGLADLERRAGRTCSFVRAGTLLLCGVRVRVRFASI